MLKTIRFCLYVRQKTKINQTVKLFSWLFYRNIINSNNIHTQKMVSKSPSNLETQGSESVTREWEDTELGRNYRAEYKKTPGTPFIIMSYNILAQKYIEYHPDLYRRIDPNFLQWEYRLDKILKELRKYHPHIICMQEVEDVHYKVIKKNLKTQNYKGVYYKRTGEKPDGCAIFFDKKLFKKQDIRQLNLYNEQELLLSRDNVAILLKLSLKSNMSQSFVVANTHLLYNPKRDDIRLAQLQKILSSLKDFTQSDSSRLCPVILMGDFNFPPSSPLFEFVTKGGVLWDGSVTDECRKELHVRNNNPEELKPLDIAHQFRKATPQSITHSMKLESILSRDQLRNRATTYHRQWIQVDHIFYTKETESNLKLLSTLLPPQVQECFPIPNAVLGSDHHAVVANFLLSDQNT